MQEHRNTALTKKKPCTCTCRCTRQRHPLVNVKRLADADAATFAPCYTVVLRGREDGAGSGRLSCDFQDCTVMFFKPRTFCLPAAARQAEGGCVLGFRPELFDGLALPVCLEGYSFFGYAPRESLHVSLREQNTLLKCLDDISEEQDWGVDKYTRGLVAERVRIFLDYCRRFYDRQFVTRRDAGRLALSQVERVADAYVEREKAWTVSAGVAAKLAEELSMSPAYLSDFLRHETGQTLAEYLRGRRFALAKDRLLHTGKPVAEIAAALGFGSVQGFCALFRKLEGCSPADFRRSC